MFIGFNRFQNGLSAFGIVPEIRFNGKRFFMNDQFFAVFDVKDTSLAKRVALQLFLVVLWSLNDMSKVVKIWFRSLFFRLKKGLSFSFNGKPNQLL